MGKAILTTFILLSFSQSVYAQALVPATSDDISEFDKQISQAQNVSHQHTHNAALKTTQKHSASFGAAVSQEAKNLKDSKRSERMGQWVNEQRRRDDENTPAAAISSGQDSSGGGNSNKDASTSSPQNDNHGNSANAPGHTKQNQQ